MRSPCVRQKEPHLWVTLRPGDEFHKPPGYVLAVTASHCWKKTMISRPNGIRTTVLALFVMSAMHLFGQTIDAATKPRNSPTAEFSEPDDVVARDKWFLNGRTVPGKSAAALLERAHQQRIHLMEQQRVTGVSTGSQSLILPLSSGAGPAWQSIGPAPIVSDPSGQQDYGMVAGRVTAIAVDQSDTTGNTVYIGGAFGGVWKSTNAAATDPTTVTWTALTDDQATLSVGAIAVSPNGKTVIVGTGEPDSALDSYYGLGILISTQSGAPGTWQLISSADGGAHPFHGLGFSKIAFNVNNPMQVVAAVGGTNGAALGGEQPGATRGLYFSSDGGQSWHLASISDNGTPVAQASATDVVLSSSNFSSNSVFYAAVRFHGFYQSTDGGQTWTRMTQPDPNELTLANCPSGSSNPSCPMARGSLAVYPKNGTAPGSDLWAIFVDGSNTNKGVWHLPSNSINWSPLAIDGITTCGDSQGCGTQQGFYDLVISAVPTSNSSGAFPDTDVYVGAVNLFKSVNGGSFINLTHVYGCFPTLAQTAHMHPDFHALDFSLNNPLIVYFGNDGGVYRTLNGQGMNIGTCGNGVNPVNSLNSNLGSLTQFISISEHPSNSSIVLGGTQDNGSPATTTAGGATTWSEVNLGDGGYNEIDPNNPLNLFTANTDATIQRCSASNTDPTCIFLPFTYLVNCCVSDPNHGLNINFPDHGDFYTPYILDPQNTNSLIIGTCRVWRGSASNPNNWTANSFGNALSNKFTDGTATACSGTEPFYVRSLDAGGPTTPTGSQVVYAGMSSGVSGGMLVGGNVF